MTEQLLPTIGLEIHAELKTRSKMFCGCKNDPHQDEPNIYVCPVCLAHPGTLPVINAEAVRHVLQVGLAIGGTVATFTEFDRKNYFYPDIPKNYQISQYQHPLVTGGRIGSVAVTRIHLEEDTARSSHKQNTSLVDFNRAGVPLMELVTEPVIHDTETAVAFARDLRLLLKYLGASDANLERGEMRIEANISVGERNGPLGTKVEVKNLNSFKAVEQAISYEIKRHRELLTRGEKITQETRGWDENKQKTFSQRMKESSHDYRYFPEPDLPKLQLDEIPHLSSAKLRSTPLVTPWDLRTKYIEAGLQETMAETLVGNVGLQLFYASVCSKLTTKEERTLAANYLTTDVLGTMSRVGYEGRDLPDLQPDEFARLIGLLTEGTISSRGAKEILVIWLQDGEDPVSIAKKHNLVQVSDTSALIAAIHEVLAKNGKVVEEYRAGKAPALQFLVGQCMKVTKGSANPQKLQELLIAEIGR